MICWVLYDIKKDKSRTKVSDACEQSGLMRVQYSVFLGRLDQNGKDTLELQISDLIDEENDSVYIFPMSKDELKDTVLMGQAFDKKEVSEEIKSMFL
ncbi:MAG TPA: CRISPR-associated endonuclease Cas2 [Balneolales bacterium]|nr:CRISPR-associated endonuclease Cas2 [Balneolales bacterium]